MCIAPKTVVRTVAPTAACPDGCGAGVFGDDCVCSLGGPAPCPPGTKECGGITGRCAPLRRGAARCPRLSARVPGGRLRHVRARRA